MLDEKFVSLVEEAETKKDINFVLQANALKRKKQGNRRGKKKAWGDIRLWWKEEKVLKIWIKQ